MRKDVREFIRRLEAAGLTVVPTRGHYRVLRDGKPLRKQNGMRAASQLRRRFQTRGTVAAGPSVADPRNGSPRRNRWSPPPLSESFYREGNGLIPFLCKGEAAFIEPLADYAGAGRAWSQGRASLQPWRSVAHRTISISARQTGFPPTLSRCSGSAPAGR
jgi:hypothetical protein